MVAAGVTVTLARVPFLAPAIAGIGLVNRQHVATAKNAFRPALDAFLFTALLGWIVLRSSRLTRMWASNLLTPSRMHLSLPGIGSRDRGQALSAARDRPPTDRPSRRSHSDRDRNRPRRSGADPCGLHKRHTNRASLTCYTLGSSDTKLPAQETMVQHILRSRRGVRVV